MEVLKGTQSPANQFYTCSHSSGSLLVTNLGVLKVIFGRKFCEHY